MSKTTPFRTWLQKIWQEHKEEVLSDTGQPVNYEMAQYFSRYRWWLRALYKQERKHAES